MHWIIGKFISPFKTLYQPFFNLYMVNALIIYKINIIILYNILNCYLELIYHVKIYYEYIYFLIIIY